MVAPPWTQTRVEQLDDRHRVAIESVDEVQRDMVRAHRGLYLFDDTLVVRHDDGCAAIDRVRIESFEPEEPINRSDEPRTLMVVDGHPIVVLPFDVTGLLEEWRQRA